MMIEMEIRSKTGDNSDSLIQYHKKEIKKT